MLGPSSKHSIRRFLMTLRTYIQQAAAGVVKNPTASYSISR